jgi:hypothetical protein
MNGITGAEIWRYYGELLKIRDGVSRLIIDRNQGN